MERYDLEETDPPELRLMVPKPQGKWVRADEAEASVAELEHLRTYTMAVERERDTLKVRLAELEAERLRFYHADGTFEVLSSPEEVIQRRLSCARRLT